MDKPLEVYVEGVNGKNVLVPARGKRKEMADFKVIGSARISRVDVEGGIHTGIYPAGDEGSLMRNIRKRAPADFNAYSIGPTRGIGTLAGPYFEVTYFQFTKTPAP
jgi:hypothetical protein